MNGPIYHEFYVMCNVDDPYAFPVWIIGTEEQDVETYIRRGLAEDIAVDQPFYVRVEHPLEYPYARYDMEDRRPTIASELGWEEAKPTRYAQAVIVLTPQMALI